MENYYRSLSADRLKRAYDLAPRRVRRYLQAELEFVTGGIQACETVLELGCGYGRVLSAFSSKAALAIGIDTSFSSLAMARQLKDPSPNMELALMDAARLGFADKSFDKVICIQNGISAFHIEPKVLIAESIRVTRTGGRVIFSSYSDQFWENRLEWFRIQAENGLIGEIDWINTRDGNIVCKDGFTATAFGPEQFRRLASQFDKPFNIVEIDGSSIFCEIIA